jgi:hypothetical protein
MKTIPILFAAVLLSTISGIAADQWTSADGKTITADFVRMDGSNVVLNMKGKEYSIPIEKLNEKSQGYARFLHEQLKQWAADNLGLPIIPEAILNDVIAFNPQLAEGKNFLVEGFVDSIERSSSLARNAGSTAEIRLQGGTQVAADFTNEADGRRTKIKFESDSVVLTKARTLSGGNWKNFSPEKTLVSEGQKIVVRAKVERGRVHGTGLASSQEVTQARLEAAKANGGLTMEEVAQMERIKIRIEFLEAQLAGNAGSATVSGTTGYVGTLTFKYSEAEKEAMKKELELLRAQLGAAAKQ